MKVLEGCQYSICCHNDEYQELKKELSQLQQEREELIKWLEDIIMRQTNALNCESELEIFRYYQGNKAELNFAKRFLSKLKESDKDGS